MANQILQHHTDPTGTLTVPFNVGHHRPRNRVRRDLAYLRHTLRWLLAVLLLHPLMDSHVRLR